MTTETETVAEVLADLAAMAAECGGLEAATIHAMTKRIAAAHAREVELLKQANIAYSSANAGLLGRVMAAESKLNHVHSCIDVLQARTDGTLGRAETGREKATLDTLVHVIGECLINARAAAPPHPSEPAARADASAQREQ